MEKNEKSVKVCKVIQKKVVGKDRVQFTTMDGRTFIEKTSKTSVGDSLVIELPSQRIMQTLFLKEGNVGYLLSGRRAGTIAKIGPLSKATLQKDALVKMQTKEENFQTLAENVIVLGEKKPVIALE